MGLPRVKHHIPASGSIARILVEGEPVSFHMHRLPFSRGRRLVRIPAAFRIRFQVDQYGAFGSYISRGGIKLEIFPRNAIETRGIFAVDDDFDVMQVSPATLFELNRL